MAIMEKCCKHFMLVEFNEKGYYSCEFTPSKTAAHVVEHDANIDLWHRRLGYSSTKILKEMCLPASDIFCEECVFPKRSSKHKGKGSWDRESLPMKMALAGVCIINKPVYGVWKYFATLNDDYWKYCEMLFVKAKVILVKYLKSFWNKILIWNL